MSAARAQPGTGARRRRGWFAALVTVSVLAALVVLAVTKLDPDEIEDALAHVDAGWIALALLMMVAAFFARAESWYAVISAAVAGKRECDTPLESRLHRGTVARALLIGMACSSVAPGRVGEGARAWVVARRLGQVSRNFALVVGTVVSQTVLNVLALALLAIAAILDSALADARLAAILAVVMLPAGLLALIFAGPPLLRRASDAAHGPTRRAARWVHQQIVVGREGLAVFGRPRLALHAACAQLGAWALQLGACYATILALGLPGHANIAAAAAVLLAVNLTAIVPLTPSNVGVFQAACIAVLHPFGVDASRGLAYGLILQAVEIFPALVLGTLALVREGASVGDLGRSARDSAAAARAGQVPSSASGAVLVRDPSRTVRRLRARRTGT